MGDVPADTSAGGATHHLPQQGDARARPRPLVVKLGGAVTGLDEGAVGALAAGIGAVREAGRPVVVVHGGGRELDDLMRRYDLQPRFVDGLRVTDRRTIDLARMVLSGGVNKAIVAQLLGCGIPALGLSGEDGGLVAARPIALDRLGHVGAVSAVDTGLLWLLLDAGYVPVLSSLAAGPDGHGCNVNADALAAAVALALDAERLLLLTDVTGVRTDPADPGSVVRSGDIGTARELLASGAALDGMVPKLQAVVAALGGGVDTVVVGPLRSAGALLADTGEPEESTTFRAARSPDPARVG